MDEAKTREQVPVVEITASSSPWLKYLAAEPGPHPGDVAARAATTPGVIRRYYDRPDLDAELSRRITEFEGIDICQHRSPNDINQLLDTWYLTLTNS